MIIPYLIKTPQFTCWNLLERRHAIKRVELICEENVGIDAIGDRGDV